MGFQGSKIVKRSVGQVCLTQDCGLPSPDPGEIREKETHYVFSPSLNLDLTKTNPRENISVRTFFPQFFCSIFLSLSLTSERQFLHPSLQLRALLVGHACKREEKLKSRNCWINQWEKTTFFRRPRPVATSEICPRTRVLSQTVQEK